MRDGDAGFVTIVAGLPRSGTSMMMHMLAAGGMPVVTVGGREADEDNPGGYFESVYFRSLGSDRSWLQDARGCAVKLIYRAVYALPDSVHYRVILMRRPTLEVISSLHGWTVRHGFPWTVADMEKLAATSGRQLDDAARWLRRRPNFSLLEVGYHQVLQRPAEAVQEVNRFLDGRLDAAVMVQVPNPSLYRVRLREGHLSAGE